MILSSSRTEYDPHLLYLAIGLTADLKYSVPMVWIYKILEIVRDENDSKKDLLKVQASDIFDLLKSLGAKLEDDSGLELCEDSTIQIKIKELLRLADCVLTDKELNQLLKGEISIDDVMNDKAKTLWYLIFKKGKDGKTRPNKDMVEYILNSSQNIAIADIEEKINKQMIRRKGNFELSEQMRSEVFRKNDNPKIMRGAHSALDSQDVSLASLEEKRNKLRLYIAHMQGYDRDLDGDGGRGIDRTTGYVIDWSDIYIADKRYSGAIIEDIDHDGLEISEIK